MSALSRGAQSSSNFEQQGTLDWVSLSKETVGFSIQVLSRLAQGGVHPYTLVIGQHIGNHFKLSSIGRKNFTNAIQGLKYFNGFDDILRFGFGVDCLPRLLGTTEQGLVCSALCAALSEFYHEDTAAEILYHMSEMMELPGDFTPSMIEWRSLIKVFQGVLSTTQFPLIIEQLRRLLPDSESGHALPGNCGPRPARAERVIDRNRYTAEAASVATILCALADLTRDKTALVKVTGRHNDLAWIAAFSTWLLDMRTSLAIHSSSDNQIVYSNCTDNCTQVQLVHTDSKDTIDGQLELSATYRLESGLALLSSQYKPKHLFFGKVAWAQCLSRTFDQAFERLLERPSSTGVILGSASRILEGFQRGMRSKSRLAKARPDGVHRLERGGDHIYGRALIQFMLEQFPELLCLERHMKAAANLSVTQAHSEYDRKMAQLQCECACQFCRMPPPSAFIDREADLSLAISKDCCLPTVVETVLVMSCVLSRAHVDDGLHPVTAGIEAIYGQLCHAKDPSRTMNSVGSPLLRHESTLISQAPPLIERDEVHRASSLDFVLHRLQHTRTTMNMLTLIFTGRKKEHVEDMRSPAAWTEQGISVYQSTLVDAVDPTDSRIAYNVVTGTIEHRGRAFPAVLSSVSYRVDNDEYSKLGVLHAGWKLSLLVTPKIDALYVVYRATTTATADTTATAVFRFSVSFLTQYFEEVIYTDRCPYNGDCVKVRFTSTQMSSPSHRLLVVNGKGIEVLCGDKASLCTNLARAQTQARRGHVVIVKRQCCLHCCLRYAMLFAKKVLILHVGTLREFDDNDGGVQE